jgi:hypothetical protein
MEITGTGKGTKAQGLAFTGTGGFVRHLNRCFLCVETWRPMPLSVIMDKD